MVSKRFGPKRVLGDCSRYRAMAKRQSTMLMFFKNADRASATEYAEDKKIFLLVMTPQPAAKAFYMMLFDTER